MIPFLDIQNISKRFGERLLFDNISFAIGEGEKVGLIAQNGTGKSTLLSIIAGDEPQDSGSVIFRNGIRVGFLRQKQNFDPESTVLDACFGKHPDFDFDANYSETETASSNTSATSSSTEATVPDDLSSVATSYDYAEDNRILKAKQILTSLKIKNLNQKIKELSGGQQKRVALANVLITEPDLFILDEPTNHLDLEMIEWLEGFLRRGNKTLLMVTHDRYFLDNVCNLILELDDQTIYTYRGNFSYYLEKRQERIDVRNATIARANNLYRTELEWMRRQPQARGHKARYREEAFYELEKIAKQRIQERQVRLKNNNVYIGSKIFECQYVSKAFPGTPTVGDTEGIVILKDFYYNFSRYEKMGIVGNNGAGKSTFIKLLLGLEQPDSGQFDIGQTVKFGYFSQDGLQFRQDQRVIDVVRDIAEYVNLGNGKHLTAAQLLERFLFSRKQQYDYIEKLSGGEQRKLYLCTVLMQDPNFLILDEPTNDLDIQTLEVLEEYLQDFPGCVIIVSHDRFFTDKVVDHLLVFHGEGKVQDFPGNYSQHRIYQKLKSNESAKDSKNAKNVNNAKPTKEAKQASSGNPSSSSQASSAKPKKLSYKETRELEQLEKDIAALETEKATIVEELSAGNISTEQIIAHGKRLPEVEALLEEKEMRWLEIQE
ncbi:MAG: ABC-F family ATP-binding cassette domain-containing protein [Bacteroidaceae bacterium]|nr:ABC-F family ATP-binding cassette domain-containing protein [Bacteroidaceae bacterium]